MAIKRGLSRVAALAAIVSLAATASALAFALVAGAHLEITSKSLAALSYSVAHDLRTPLRAISGYAEILGGLLDNAWKYTAGCDDATIEVGTIPVTGPGVCCYVRDNGAGFDSAYADKLFQPFQQLHRTGEYRTGEYGTGLAIIRRIIERHGGQTWADGAVGRGAVFYFTLGAHPTAALPAVLAAPLLAAPLLAAPLESAVPSP